MPCSSLMNSRPPCVACQRLQHQVPFRHNLRTGRTSVRCHAAANQQTREDSQACSPLSRRGLLQALSATLLATTSSQAAFAEDSDNASDVPFKTLSYPTLAFEFQYPVATTTGRKLPVIISRKPERYSSAAPLTADARQRIVTELVDFPDGITISVSVGPPPPWLGEIKTDNWKPRDVANAVLIDRATARVTTGQRKSLDQIDNVTEKQAEDGSTYYFYDHVSQGSPSTFTPTERETFRKASSVTTYRVGKDGKPYLYTLNLACPEERWAELGGLYHKAADSFKLTPPTRAYVSPDSSPWLFF